jgi:hypothetical protein
VQLAFDDVEEVVVVVVVGFGNNLGSWQTEMMKSDGAYYYQS